MASQAAEFATHRPSYWRAVAARCTKDFTAYLSWVRGYPPPAWHHRVIIERFQYGDLLECVLAPPAVAKTSIGIAWAEWTLGRIPNYRWLIVSEVSSGVATTIVSDIAATIELNEKYHMVFGQLKDPTGRSPWSTQTIFLRPLVTPARAKATKVPVTPPPPFPWLPPRGRDQRVTGRHPSAKAAGLFTGYAGLRCEGIIGDDLVSDRISNSERLTQRAVDTVHQKMLARLTPHPENKVMFFGQHYAAADFYTHLRAKGVVVFDNNPNRDGLWVLDPESDRPEAAA